MIKIVYSFTNLVKNNRKNKKAKSLKHNSFTVCRNAKSHYICVMSFADSLILHKF